MLPSAATNFPIGCLISKLFGMRFRGYAGRQNGSLLWLRRSSTASQYLHSILPLLLPNTSPQSAHLSDDMPGPYDSAVHEQFTGVSARPETPPMPRLSGHGGPAILFLY